MELENSIGKYKILIKLVIVTVTVYFAIKYLLPLFLPFLISYVMAGILRPVVNYLYKKLRINKKAVAVVVIVLVIIILAFILGIVVNTAIEQIRNIVTNYDSYLAKFDKIADKTCCMAEKYSGIKSGEIKCFLREKISVMLKGAASAKLIFTAMNKSVDTLIVFGELIAFILTVIVSTYYILVSGDIQNSKENILIKELRKIAGNVKKMCSAYIKTQLVIMAITSIICFVGFIFMGNDYALVLSLLVGTLDALPLIGIGLILIPWCIIYFIAGRYVKGIIILTVFVICYLVREILEPKLMGKQTGIAPIIVIMAVYVGYKIFGLLGVVLGPIGYILINSIMKEESS